MSSDNTWSRLGEKRVKATIVGFCAILMWGMLALLTSLTNRIPPLQLTAMTFAIAFCVGIFFWMLNGADSMCFRQRKSLWLNGVFGLFGYHICYFFALKNAPTVEASLIAYLWPLFIVIFSSLLPSEKLHWFHVAGAVIGFAGAAVIILKGCTLSLKQEYLLGYLGAFLCSIIWSAYSVISRSLGESPTELVGGFCGVTALLSAMSHLIFEKSVMPNWPEALAITGLGVGPVGAAFFAWDYGVKGGNIKILGVLSYTAPLVSTIMLILFGRAEPTWKVIAACFLIVIGASIAALDRIKMLAKVGKDKSY